MNKKIYLLIGIFGILLISGIGSIAYADGINDNFSNTVNNNANIDNDYGLISTFADSDTNYRNYLDYNQSIYMYSSYTDVPFEIDNFVDKSKYQIVQTKVNLGLNDLQKSNGLYTTTQSIYADYEPSGIYITENDYYDNHYCDKHILDTNTNYGYSETDFTNQAYGSIEYWIATSNDGLFSQFKLQYGSSESIIVFFNSGNMMYYSGGSYYTLFNSENYRMYHIRIDFDCTTGGYLGLGQYKWRISVDGLPLGTFSFKTNTAYINRFRINTGTSQASYSLYLDGFSIVGVDGYSFGQNKLPNGYTYSPRAFTTSYAHYNDGGSYVGSTCLTAEFYYYLGNQGFKIRIHRELGGTISDPLSGTSEAWTSYLFDFDFMTSERQDYFINFEGYIGLNPTTLQLENNYRIVLLDENKTILASYDLSYEYQSAYPFSTLGIKYLEGYDVLFMPITNYLMEDIRTTKFRMLYCNDNSIVFDDYENNCTVDDDIGYLPESELPQNAPSSSLIWYYTSWSLEFDANETLTAGSGNTTITFDYPLITISAESVEWQVYQIWYTGFFLADFFIWLANVLIIAGNFLLYFAWQAIIFVIVFLIVGGLATLFINYVGKYIVLGSMWLLYGLYLLVYVVIPTIWNWFIYEILPILLDGLATLIGIFLGTILWILSGTSLNLNDIINAITDFFNAIFDIFYEILVFILENISTILLYVGVYILILYLLYPKYLYVKSKGYTVNASRKKESYTTMSAPVNGILKIAKIPYDIIPII